jgi:hypothetical protein
VVDPRPTDGWRYPNLGDTVADRPGLSAEDRRELSNLMQIDVTQVSPAMSAFLSR